MGLLATERDVLLVEPPLTYGELATLLRSASQRYAILRDGDGRYRGIVRATDLFSQLEQYPHLDEMELLSSEADQSSPVFYGPALFEDSTPLEIRRLALRRELPFLPCLDSRGRLVELLSNQDALKRGLHDNPTVIMAGGFGVRMRPLTEMMPKPLIPLHEGRLIDRVLDHLVDCGFHQFYLTVHYLKEQIMGYLGDGRQRGIRIEYIVEDAPQGTAGSLRRFAQSTGLPVVVSNGDVITNQHFSEILDYHERQKAQITLVCKQEGVDISYGVVEAGEDGVLTSIQEKPRLSYLVNTGIYVIDPAILHLLPQRSYFMTDLVDAVREEGGRVCVFQTEEYWQDVGTMDCYAQVMQDIKLGKVRGYPARQG